MAKLFSPFTVKGIELKNRIGMSPMCTYSCYTEDGIVTPWHKIHYGARALGQVALIMLEATSITPQGRISPYDLGLWSDEHIIGLKDLVGVIKENGSIAGIQIGHAGRKAVIGGPIIAPSSIPFKENDKVPKTMGLEEIENTVNDFKKAIARAKAANFDIIELHAAHGYLISEFLSPITNKRTDQYGGNRNNRYKFLEKVVEAARTVWDGPLFIRLSIDEYHKEGNSYDDILYYIRKLKKQGVNLIDCSSGAITPTPPPTYPGYQVKYSELVRKNIDIPTSTVGLITSPMHAEEIIQNDRADVLFLGRELLRNPNWPIYAAKELKYNIKVPHQYERGWK